MSGMNAGDDRTVAWLSQLRTTCLCTTSQPLNRSPRIDSTVILSIGDELEKGNSVDESVSLTLYNSQAVQPFIGL